jgi:hypothetical protein
MKNAFFRRNFVRSHALVAAAFAASLGRCPFERPVALSVKPTQWDLACDLQTREPSVNHRETRQLSPRQPLAAFKAKLAIAFCSSAFVSFSINTGRLRDSCLA